MVSSKSLLAVGLLLLSSCVSAAAIEETDPANLDGPIIKAIINPATGDVDISRGPPVARRGYPPRPPPPPPPPPSCPRDVKSLVTLLSNKKQDGFCKSYIDIHPVVCKTITVTTCGNQNPKCTPKTVTTVIPKTRTVTNTVTANTPTVTVDVTATESATITTTDTIKITSTVGTPLITPPPVKRGNDIPGYLRNCPPDRLSSACSSLVKDYIKTTTITKTKTTSSTARTITSPVTSTLATRTQTATFTPAPVTFTTTVGTTTITVTARQTVTETTTICPRATTGVTGIAVTAPGTLRFPGASNNVDCCTACFNTPSCVGWAFFSLCAFGVDSAPNSGPPTAQCPSGLGTFSLFSNGLVEWQGGPGPCVSE